MTKRRRESNLTFDNNGYAIVETDGLKFKWNVSEETKKNLETYADEFDISVVVTVNHQFMVDVRRIRTDEIVISQIVEML